VDFLLGLRQTSEVGKGGYGREEREFVGAEQIEAWEKKG
jgi:hypothetical protein